MQKWRVAVSFLVILQLSLWLPGTHFAQASPMPSVSAWTGICQLLEEQVKAVRADDKQGYLSTLSGENPLFIQEEAHWFDDAVQVLTASSRFTRRVVEIEESPTSMPRHSALAKVVQQYRDGDLRQAVYWEVYRMEGGEWKDVGRYFREVKEGAMLIHYADKRDAELASLVATTGNEIVRALKSRFGWNPQGLVEVNLYDDAEVFRQSVKLSLPRWAVGWNEYGESIKFLVLPEPYDREQIPQGIAHEMVHKMLGEMTLDNAAYWLQEGMAEYYASLLMAESEPLQAKEMPLGNGQLWSLPQLMEQELETLPHEQALQYYVQSRRLVEFMIHEYGETALRQIMSRLSEYPYLARTTAEKQEELNRRTASAMEEVLGISIAEFSRQWEEQLIQSIG